MLTFRNSILESIARGDSLTQSLLLLCEEAESRLDGSVCSIMAVDRAGLLRPLAAPAFPQPYQDALNGLLIGPDVGSCGTAIYRNETVVAVDIETDAKWAAFKGLALPLGWHACTSAPIRDAADKAIGAVAIYFKEPRPPTPAEMHLIEACADLSSLAIARHQRVVDRERRATIDVLTGLPNRAAFDEALSQLRCELPGSWALLTMDVDNLKSTNDTFGHDAGDELIRAVGSRIEAALSPDATFRLGGDEFVTIVQNEPSIRDLHKTAEAVFAAVSQPLFASDHTVTPKVTIGGAVLAPQDAHPTAVRRNADYALYHAKETRRGGFVRYWPGVGSRISERRNAIREVLEALHEDRIDAHYQPIVRLATGEVVAFEALCRLKSKAGRTLPAVHFQEAFADVRVSQELTSHMLKTVARDLRSWLDAGLMLDYVSVNTTSVDFYTNALPSQIDALFEELSIPLQKLVIEVTENAYLGERDRVANKGIQDLKLRGVRVALDDFGAGYAALNHLLTFPIDIIKIDRSFVRRLSHNDPSQAIIKGIAQIAHELNIAVVAEGIENAAHASALLEMQYVFGQGYFFSRPVERSAASAILSRGSIVGQGNKRDAANADWSTAMCPALRDGAKRSAGV